MSKRSQTSPIFILGAPRSGTTLLAAMMNAHCRLSCGNETHFFEWLRGAVVDYLTDRRHWPQRACDYASRLKHLGKTIFELYQVDFVGYSTALALEPPSISAILNCFMKIHLSQTGKPRWVEKTPGHLKQFTRIRDFFPDSPVICVFRDPRDVALSLMDAPWGPSTFVDGLLLWKSYLKYYRKIIINDTNVLTIKFEDLVQNPLEISKRMCHFIKEPFDSGMLDTSQSATSVGGSLEPYKQNVAKPADPGRAFAWRKNLQEHDLVLADTILGEDLLWLGYPLSQANLGTTDGTSTSGCAQGSSGFWRQ
jgi:hypothetical protein